MPEKTLLAGDIIDAPAACAVPFRPYCGGVVTRSVSEYMLVLALCLVVIVIEKLRAQLQVIVIVDNVIEQLLLTITNPFVPMYYRYIY